MSVRVELLDPNGDPLPVLAVTVTEAVNQGWTWSATLSHIPHTYTVLEETNRSLLDAFLEDATFTLTLEADGETLELPPLVVTDYQEDVSGGGVLSGMDLVMYRLTRSTHVIDDSWGLSNTTSTDIIEAMAAEVSLSDSLSGHEAFEIPVFELEEGRTNFLAPLVRILDVVGYEFRVTAGETSSGAVLEFYPLEFAPDGEDWPQPDWSRVTRQRAFSDRVTQFWMQKTTRMNAGANLYFGGSPETQALPTFLNSAQIQWAPGASGTLWSGDPAAGGTEVGTSVAFQAGTVTHVRQDMGGAGAATVRGTADGTIPAGVDLAFSHFHDSGISPPRPLDDPWVEQMWPDKAYATDRVQLYMWMRNRATHTMTFEGPPCLWLGLGYRLTWPGQPESRVESITHSLGQGQASTSVQAAVLASGQW